MRPVRVNLASDILRHFSVLFCDILLLCSPNSAISSDIRVKRGSFFPVRILAGGSCEMRESHAECVRVGNYVRIPYSSKSNFGIHLLQAYLILGNQTLVYICYKHTLF